MTFFHVRSAIIQRSIGCHIVRCFKMEPFDTKAGRYVLVNKLCGLRWCPDGKPCAHTYVKMCFCRYAKNINWQEVSNECPLRFAVSDLLKGFVDDVTSFDELQEKLDDASQKNILTILGEKSHPTSISDDVVYSSRTWRRVPLHLYASTEMLLYLLAGWHTNYARYDLLFNDDVKINS